MAIRFQHYRQAYLFFAKIERAHFSVKKNYVLRTKKRLKLLDKKGAL
jgi:hypothetical protein